MSAIVAAELNILLSWISKREAVRQAKEVGRSKPWTDDPLLRDYRWCNVRRMDDRVSQWLMHRWYGANVRPSALVTSAVLARLVNWPDALAELSPPFRLGHLGNSRKILQRRVERGEKVFTGAYIVPGVPGQAKIDSVFDLVEAINGDSREIAEARTMREMWQLIRGYSGLGPFLAGQVVADLAFLTPWHDRWPDRVVWAPIGPGSRRGMNRLMGRPKDAPLPQERFEPELGTAVDLVRKRLPKIWVDRQLVAMDVQNCLCEFDKYRRLTLGEGTVRARYPGAGP